MFGVLRNSSKLFHITLVCLFQFYESLLAENKRRSIDYY